MEPQENRPIAEDEIIPLRRNAPNPEENNFEPDDILASDEERDIEFGLKVLSANSYQWKNAGSEEREAFRKRLIACFVIFGVAIFLLLLLWFIASIMPKKRQRPAVMRSHGIEKQV